MKVTPNLIHEVTPTNDSAPYKKGVSIECMIMLLSDGRLQLHQRHAINGKGNGNRVYKNLEELTNHFQFNNKTSELRIAKNIKKGASPIKKQLAAA